MKTKKFFLNSKKAILAIFLSGAIFISASYVNRNFELTKNLDIFATLYRELYVNYVDEINPSELIKTAIDSMLESLDPYTNFISESEIEEYRFMTTGQYGGIGAAIHRRDDKIVISEPYQGFPAQKAGLIAGDIILEINENPADKLSIDDVRVLLHGQPGTESTLKIKRYGEEEPILITLDREIIKVDNIPYYGMLDDNTGFIKLIGFTQGASLEFREALLSLKNDHDMENLIIDLRGNGGGLLNEAVSIVNLFIEKDKVVVETRGRITERNTTHRTLNNPVDTDIPLAVLIDRGSASAAEIVAGAIQDFDRGVVIGERTFGKGLVQNIVPLAYNTQLKVTIAKYYIPSGRCIQAIDYAQINEDGSVAEIPDSLKVPFETQNGRIVYDGGGIEPDIQSEKPYPASITIALIRQFFVFDYASKYFYMNDSIDSPGTFEINENIYSDFVEFVNSGELSYETSSEEQIERIIEAAQDDDYYHLLEDYIINLKQKVEKTKADDIYTHKDEIKMLLKDEIIGRYYYTKGRIKASLDADDDIITAIETVNNKEKYSEILSGNL